MKNKWSGMVAVALVAFGMVSLAKAEEGTSRGRTISVSGQGKVSAVPDQARLEFEVQAEAVQLDEASSRAKTRMNEVLKAVKSFGLSEKDIQTVRYNVQPKYKYDKEGNENKQVGFTVSNRLRVVLKNLDLAGKVLEAVTKAGVSQIEGPSFGFADPSKLELLALKDAMEDARSKAEALAQSAGVELGKVYSVNQSSLGAPSPRPMMAMSAMRAGGDVPIEKGENEVTAQVEVVFTIK